MSLLGTGHTPSAGASAEAEALIEEARARTRRRRRRIALTVVCIAALATGVLVATNGFAGSRPTATARSGGAAAVAEPSGPPAYFLAATDLDGGYTSPQIRESATGKLVAFVPQRADYDPPYGLAATGAGSFVVGMMTPSDCATRFFRFHLGDQGRPGALTPVGPTLPGDLTAVAASTGGGLIAYAIDGSGCTSGSGGKVGSYLGVLDTRTGQTRQWADASPYPKLQPVSVPGQLSMSADGRLLAFAQVTGRPSHGGLSITGGQVRVLPTDAPPGTVAERSRLAARISSVDVAFGAPTVLLSPTGTSFYVCTQPFSFPQLGATRATETARITAYATATGKATGVIASFIASYPISPNSNGYAPLSLGCSSMALDPSGRFLLVPYLTTISNPKADYSGGSLTAALINTGTRARSTWILPFGEGHNPGVMTVAW